MHPQLQMLHRRAVRPVLLACPALLLGRHLAGSLLPCGAAPRSFVGAACGSLLRGRRVAKAPGCLSSSVGSNLRAPGSMSLAALPLDQADGGKMLAASSALLEFSKDSQLAEFLPVVPESKDIPALADLLNRAFERFLDPYKIDGPLAWPVNSLLMASEREFKRIRLGQRLASVLSLPSVRRPLETDSIGVAVVRRSQPEAPPIGYFELLLLPPDGRRAGPTAEEAEDEEAAARAAMEEARRTAMMEEPTTTDVYVAPVKEPYLQCLCVAPEIRRQGLGRALVGLAESIVVQVWGKERLYLHVDEDEATSQLVSSLGYKVLGKPNLIHMCKALASVY